jgi:hypothetical protein
MSVEIVVFVVLDATRLKAMKLGPWYSYRVVSYIVFVELGREIVDTERVGWMWHVLRTSKMSSSCVRKIAERFCRNGGQRRSAQMDFE